MPGTETGTGHGGANMSRHLSVSSLVILFLFVSFRVPHSSAPPPSVHFPTGSFPSTYPIFIVVAARLRARHLSTYPCFSRSRVHMAVLRRNVVRVGVCCISSIHLSWCIGSGCGSSLVSIAVMCNRMTSKQSPRVWGVNSTDVCVRPGAHHFPPQQPGWLRGPTYFPTAGIVSG